VPPRENDFHGRKNELSFPNDFVAIGRTKQQPLITFAAVTAAALGAEDRPNILFIYTDE
jgi:hypothetical protein